MPDLTFHLSQQCAQLRKGVFRQVLSSDGARRYSVAVFPEGANCTCPGNKYHGHCKHVDQVRAQICTWDLEHGAEEQSLQQNVNCVCPKCGGETDLVRVAA